MDNATGNSRRIGRSRKVMTYTNKHGQTATIEKAKERNEYRATMNGEVYRFDKGNHTIQDVKKYLDCREK